MRSRRSLLSSVACVSSQHVLDAGGFRVVDQVAQGDHLRADDVGGQVQDQVDAGVPLELLDLIQGVRAEAVVRALQPFDERLDARTEPGLRLEVDRTRRHGRRGGVDVRALDQRRLELRLGFGAIVADPTGPEIVVAVCDRGAL